MLRVPVFDGELVKPFTFIVFELPSVIVHEEGNVIKLALAHLIERLQSNGHTWIDTQQVNGIIRQWGGEDIARNDFFEKLDRSRVDAREQVRLRDRRGMFQVPRVSGVLALRRPK